jgi:hypothetical protein
MNAVIVVGSVVLLVMLTAGIRNLQSWLESCDYNRHFED